MAPNGVEDFSSKGQESISGDGSLDDYTEEMEEDYSFADHGVAAVVKGGDNCHSIYDKVENFHLQCGASAVSIMQLPLCKVTSKPKKSPAFFDDDHETPETAAQTLTMAPGLPLSPTEMPCGGPAEGQKFLPARALTGSGMLVLAEPEKRGPLVCSLE
ncbi:unnamed protein product [Calypogeia fissa]